MIFYLVKSNHSPYDVVAKMRDTINKSGNSYIEWERAPGPDPTEYDAIIVIPNPDGVRIPVADKQGKDRVTVLVGRGIYEALSHNYCAPTYLALDDAFYQIDFYERIINAYDWKEYATLGATKMQSLYRLLDDLDVYDSEPDSEYDRIKSELDEMDCL